MLSKLNQRQKLLIALALPMIVIATLAVGSLIFLDSSSGIRPYGLFALGGLLISGAGAFFLVDSVVEEISDPPSPSSTHLVVSDNQNREAEAAVVREAAIKASLANIVVNLARRSQSLLDRQVEYLDKLESKEEDPDTLESLFKIDHLATRMRRNAESLIVLSEAEPGKRRGGAVEVTDALRVAIGEIENYQRGNMTSSVAAKISSNNAIDLAHLLAELMENATMFAPPETIVDLDARMADQGLMLTVVDRGVGMSEDRLSAANETITNPPELGLSMERSLGFAVIGRLARRLGAVVRLAANADGGVTATVTVPESNLLDQAAIDGAGQPSAAALGRAAAGQSRSQPDLSNIKQPETLTTLSQESVSPPLGVSEATPPPPPPPPNTSPALARLLGLNPEALAPEPAPLERSTEPAMPADWSSQSPYDAGSAQPQQTASGLDGDPPFWPEDASQQPVQESVNEAWTPPEVTPDAPPFDFDGSGPAKLEEALPSGDALEAGMDSLLDDPASSGGGLTKRQRGTSKVPVGEGRPVASTARKPEEVRAMLSQYRAGLKGQRPPPPLSDGGGARPDATRSDDAFGQNEEQ